MNHILAYHIWYANFRRPLQMNDVSYCNWQQLISFLVVKKKLILKLMTFRFNEMCDLSSASLCLNQIDYFSQICITSLSFSSPLIMYLKNTPTNPSISWVLSHEYWVYVYIFYTYILHKYIILQLAILLWKILKNLKSFA